MSNPYLRRSREDIEAEIEKVEELLEPYAKSIMRNFSVNTSTYPGSQANHADDTTINELGEQLKALNQALDYK